MNVRTVASVAVLLMLLATVVGGPLFYLRIQGITASGTVVSKQERFELVAGGRWRHVLEVTYRYRPSDDASPMTSSDSVDSATFERVNAGDTVRIRYNPIAFLRYTRGYGAEIEGTSAWTRFFPESDEIDAVDLLLVGIAGALCVLAFTTRASLLVALACAAGGTVLSAILQLGPFALAALFWGWRRTRRPVVAAGLVASIVLTPELTWWRIPHPPPEPSTPLVQTTGLVRDVRTITSVWGTRRRSGETLPVPFDIADIELTPPPPASPVHVVDRVDSGSLPALVRGARLPLVYSPLSPHGARLAAGSRTYDRQLFLYLMEMTFGGAAIIALVLVPVWRLLAGWFRRTPLAGRRP